MCFTFYSLDMTNILPSFYSGACLNWTTEGQTSGTCKANTKTDAQPKAKHPTLVVPVIPSQNKGNKHQYLVAANGKLLDIAVIDEKPQPQSTKSAKVSSSGQEDSFCPKCSLEHDDPWVFCPVCKIVIHKTCILMGCICNYKPHSRHWVRPYLVLFMTHFV